MEYIYGTANIGGVMHENLKVINGEALTNTALTAGEYFTTVREYEDSTITDRCRIDRLYETVETQEARYDFYAISEHYRYIDRTKTLAGVKEASGIAFVTLAEAGSIDEVTAGEHAALFEEWKADMKYIPGQLRRYEDRLYKCLTEHTSQGDWTPDEAVSLWVRAADPAEEWPAWSAPVGAQDAYQAGDKVSHNGKHWQSAENNNVWEPGVYGWEEKE